MTNYFPYLNHSASFLTLRPNKNRQSPTYYSSFPYSLLHSSENLSSLGHLQTEIFHSPFITPLYHQSQLSFLTSLSPAPGQDLERAQSSQERKNETPGSSSRPGLLTFRRQEICVPARLSSQGPEGLGITRPAPPRPQTKNLHKPSTSPGLGVPQSFFGPLVGNSEIQSFKWLPPLMMSFQKSVDETYSKRFPVNFITKGLCVDDEDENTKYHIQIYINGRILRCRPRISHLNPQDYECNEISHP